MVFAAIGAALGGKALLDSAQAYFASKEARSRLREGKDASLGRQQEIFREQFANIQRRYRELQGQLSPYVQRQNRAQERYFESLRAGIDPQTGAFFDPNLDQRRFGADSAADTELGRLAQEERLAGAGSDAGLDQDAAVQQARRRQLANRSLFGDERFRFAQDTALTSDSFEESPGYQFRVEESERGLDRQLARGGGLFGGRALLELDRRRQGLASQEYDAYARRRQFDLSRQDAAAGAYQGLRATDVAREDAAVNSFLGRRGQDIGREEAAITRNQDLGLFDIGRQDQSFYNFLGNLGNAATGFGAQYATQGAQSNLAFAGLENTAFGSFLANQANTENQFGLALGGVQSPAAGAAAAGSQGLSDLASLYAFFSAGGAGA